MPRFILDIDSLPICTAVYKKENNDFIYVAANKAAEKINANKPPGCKHTAVFQDVKKSALFDVLHRVEVSGEAENFSTSFCKSDPGNGWKSKEAVKLSDGTVAVFCDVCHVENELDVRGLQLKQQLSDTEKFLEHQKNTFQHILEHSESLSVQGYNEKHEVIYWNKGSEILYGYSATDAMGEKLETLIIPETMRQPVHEAVEKWIHQGVAIPSSELVLMDKNGNDVNVFSQHIMIQLDSRHQEMYCIDIDLKEIKFLQNELLIQRNLLRTIFDVIPDLIWLKDIDGKYLACNTMFERFSGINESEIIGKTDADYADARQAKMFRDNDIKTIEEKRSRSSEEYLSFADDGYEGLFETVKTPIRDSENNITGVLGIARDITERREREAQLEKYAHYDTLTGLANRAQLLDHLRRLTNQRKSSSRYSAVLFIDLDRFKEINDTVGHSTGDQVLILVSRRLQNIIRKGDTLARHGGDEFTILLEQIKTPIDASDVAQKILDILREPILIGDHQFYVTTSIGIAIYPDDGSDAETLLRYADSAMYKAKENGRDSFEFYTQDLSERALERVLIENSLRRAISNHEFVLHYQPQIDVISKKVICAEALIRWHDPQMGLVAPYEFIPVAELSGQIIDIGKWVIRQAMEDISQWKKNGIAIETVSINLSAKQLSDKGFITTIKQTLELTKCKPEWIEFEVTEGYAMRNPEEAIILLGEINQLGCKLSIDDFGTGYSSLARLKRLPVQKLKIDQSFVRDIPGDSDDEEIVNAVILIAQSMRLEVIAEGVENEAQQKFLLEHGCKLSQGYLYAPAMPKEQFENYLI